MHLKAYAVDGARLRTGSGNFSHSGLAFQDNDLILVDDPATVAEFERNFDAIWSRGGNAEAMFERERGGPSGRAGRAKSAADSPASAYFGDFCFGSGSLYFWAETSSDFLAVA